MIGKNRDGWLRQIADSIEEENTMKVTTYERVMREIIHRSKNLFEKEVAVAVEEFFLCPMASP